MAGEMHGQVFQPSKSKLGDVDAKYMVLIIYFGAAIIGFVTSGWGGFIVPLIVYLVDKENKFLAFHALQALIMYLVLLVLAIIMTIISVAAAVGIAATAIFNPVGAVAGGLGLGALVLVTLVVGVVFFIFAILAALAGYKYQIYLMPIFGKFAEKKIFGTQ